MKLALSILRRAIFGGDGTPGFDYYRPGGVDRYNRPGGVDYYERP